MAAHALAADDEARFDALLSKALAHGFTDARGDELTDSLASGRCAMSDAVAQLEFYCRCQTGPRPPLRFSIGTEVDICLGPYAGCWVHGSIVAIWSVNPDNGAHAHYEVKYDNEEPSVFIEEDADNFIRASFLTSEQREAAARLFAQAKGMGALLPELTQSESVNLQVHADFICCARSTPGQVMYDDSPEVILHAATRLVPYSGKQSLELAEATITWMRSGSRHDSASEWIHEEPKFPLQNATLQEAGCAAIHSICLTPTEQNLPSALLECIVLAMTAHPSVQAVQRRGCAALAAMCARHEWGAWPAKLRERAAMESVRAVQAFPECARLVGAFVYFIGGSIQSLPAARADKIVASGAGGALVDAINRHPTHWELQFYASCALSAYGTLREDSVEAVETALEAHSKSWKQMKPAAQEALFGMQDYVRRFKVHTLTQLQQQQGPEAVVSAFGRSVDEFAAEARASALRRGDTVTLQGLVGRPELNGRSATVILPLDQDGGRCPVRVRLHGAFVDVKVRWQNMRF